MGWLEKYEKGGEITTSGKVRDFLHKTIGVPMAINQLGYDISGGQSPITENSLTNEELNSLRNIVRKNLKDSRNTIEYRDWNKAGSKETGTYKEIKEAGSDPITNLKYTLGRTAINVNNEDTTVVDRYNFNNQKDYADDSIIDYLKSIKRIGVNNPYIQLRNLGSHYGSDERHGSPVNIKINQKRNGGELQKLDDLVNFTNYNKPTDSKWLSKYQ